MRITGSTGNAISLAVTMHGGILHMGSSCAVADRSDWHVTVAGSVTGKTAALTGPGGSGTLTLAGSTLTGTIVWQGQTARTASVSFELARS